MCGITGYIGKRLAPPILLKGLKRLEYRGYDSSGIAIIHNDKLKHFKKAGKVKDLEKLIEHSSLNGTCGIAHTRWATHGEPNDVNSHPHLNETGTIALVHNGIIENYNTLKEILINKGVVFKSETDTEVLVHLISTIYYQDKILSFEDAVRAALQEVVGAYGIVVMCTDEPDTLIAARMGSPLVLGVGENEYFLASDASPIVGYTRNVIYFEDGEMVKLTKSSHEISNILSKEVLTKTLTEIDLSIEEIEKGEFPHFMLKEIHDQTHSITNTMRGRLNISDGTTNLGGIEDFIPNLLSASRIYITACGTSWHAGLIGKHLIETYAKIPVHVEYASEFRYRNVIIDSSTVLIAVSQSGETADTLAAIRKAKDLGALALGICNVVGSTIARETDAGIYTHAGPEIGVASTKAFTSQVTVFTMLALMLGRKRGIERNKGRDLILALYKTDDHVESILNNSKIIKMVAKRTKDVNHFLYLGRGINFPVALEGALKLKEISYIHAEGYPAAEMKHGPIALIDENMPVIFLAPKDNTFLKILANIQEVKARKGIIITITDTDNKELNTLSDFVLQVPKTHQHVFPITSSIILQLLAYELAILRGCEIDQPRNLAKSVTVE
ncbi:MAG: glutamine--fructose-6-phosphate transaminase (isomerizing) [Fidelibacterota bacterium]|jgi:glucosamine--fructose-6-phosphate aminotransferase (isomerizing)|tara:strand:+ start:14510 stop:16351 length:1842 start_codon:yes stop_codon:yes gene_type:complete